MLSESGSCYSRIPPWLRTCLNQTDAPITTQQKLMFQLGNDYGYSRHDVRRGIELRPAAGAEGLFAIGSPDGTRDRKLLKIECKL